MFFLQRRTKAVVQIADVTKILIAEINFVILYKKPSRVEWLLRVFYEF
jgi:hypothetical protein